MAVANLTDSSSDDEAMRPNLQGNVTPRVPPPRALARALSSAAVGSGGATGKPSVADIVAGWPSDVPLRPVRMGYYDPHPFRAADVSPAADVCRRWGHLISGFTLECDAYDAHMPAVTEAVAELTHLTSVSLACGLGPDSAEPVARMLARLPSLVELDLSRNSFGAAGLARVMASIGNLSGLASLTLRRANLDADSVKPLAAVLPRLTALTSLMLADSQLSTVDACTTLAQALRHTTSLTLLDVSRHGRSSSACAALGPGLAALTQLRVLRASEYMVPMCEAGIRKLAPYLTNLAHLTELNVAGNRLGAPGIRALTAALAELPALTRLVIEDLRFKDDETRAAYAQHFLRRAWHYPALPPAVQEFARRGPGARRVGENTAVLGQLHVPPTAWSGVPAPRALADITLYSALRALRARQDVWLRRSGLLLLRLLREHGRARTVCGR